MLISVGSERLTRNSAACTSAAAASMSRRAENSSRITLSPWMFSELLPTRPGMAENSFSSGVATEAAMFSGLAPGSLALTSITGVS